MRAISIVIYKNKISETGYNNLILSSKYVKNDFEISKWNAVTPENVDIIMDKFNLKWNYPWNGSFLDEKTKLLKSAYNTINPKARIACAVSHYCLWSESAEKNETLLILEHDAIFINRIDFIPKDMNADIFGINNPINATRKANIFHAKIQESAAKLQLVPTIDDDKIPQGLAGNSAYIIKPNGAKKLLELVKIYGLWPNDAIMCKQLIPGLSVTKKYYTKIQNLESTTSK